MRDRELQIREQARKNFKNHVATVRVDENDIMVLEWRNKNGSSNLYIQYIIDKKRGFLSISGDLGDCNSCWYNPLKIDDMIRYTQNIGYWMGKFQATSEDYTYEQSDITNDLEEIKKYYIEHKSDYTWEDKSDEEIEEDFEEISFELEYNWEGGTRFAQDVIDIIEKYDSEWWDGGEWLRLGRRINPRVYIWSEGLKMAYEQMKSSKKI